jgi:hypothetical protein
VMITLHNINIQRLLERGYGTGDSDEEEEEEEEYDGQLGTIHEEHMRSTNVDDLMAGMEWSDGK